MAKSIEYKDFFELINPNNEQVVAAIFTTYGFDAELFEKHILPDVLSVIGNATEDEMRFRNQVALRLREVPVTVFSDGNQYAGGRTFLYEHKLVTGVTFHPKYHLLQFQNFLRVIVGSCNITKSGLCYNAETVWYIDIEDGKENSITKDVKETVNWMFGQFAEDDALKEIKRFLNKQIETEGYPKLVFPMRSNSPYRQYLDNLKSLKKMCKRLSIVSPFFESDKEAAIDDTVLMQFAKDFYSLNNSAVLRIFFPAMEIDDKYKVTAPVNILKQICESYPKTECYVVNNRWSRDDDADVPRTLHAKIIMAELENGKCLTMSGSTNFTRNAMMSHSNGLRNVEISVLEYGKNYLVMPNAKKVTISQLIYEKKEANGKGINIFIEDVCLSNETLLVKVDLEKVNVPFYIRYQDKEIYCCDKKVTEIISINCFKIKRAMDIHVICYDYDFYFPIRVENKLDYVTEDLKMSFEIKMKDVIDYWAGKYTSISEMERVIKMRQMDSESVSVLGALYFRHNLQRYFKALNTIRKSLEEPFYSEIAFESYLTGPFSLKAIIRFILDDYFENVSFDSETFVLLTELENMLVHLQFQEDRLPREIKKKKLNNLFSEAKCTQKNIYKKADKNLKKQYDVMLIQYGLEVK